jgi:hypothetical protein
MMADVRTTDGHRVARSVEELLAGAERREPFFNPDGRSTAAFERVWIDGRPHIVKYVHLDDDFMMRMTGDIGCRPVRAWAAGLLDSAPDLVDHAIVGAAGGHGRNGWGAALLMRDVSSELVVVDGSPFRPEEQERFVDHLAGWCASTWGFRDDSLTGPGLQPYAIRWAYFAKTTLDGEAAMGWKEPVPRIAAEGWARFWERAPRSTATIIEELWRESAPLAAALRSTPSCLLHGDAKASNMGIAPDGRMILIDWAYVGEGPAAHEIAWYVALNREKLPVSKEETIESFRAGLERHGIDTSGWWERQLGLALLGTLVQFGWEKALGDDDELGWWCAAARDGARFL